MQHNWSRYLRLILASLAATTIVGWSFGYALIGLLTGLIVYLWWTLVQARQLYQWLGNPEARDEPPQSIGMWGSIFDGLNKLHQSHLRTQDRLRTQINRVQESTNAMRDGVIMTNARGAMEWWNGSAEYLLDFRPTDRGQLIHNLIRSPSFKRYFDSRDYREPLQLNSPARLHIHLLIQISLFGDDDRLIVARDVTRLHHLEQMRRDFTGNVSHEMRTPLTVISGYLETMVDHGHELPPKWRRAISTMATQSSRMEDLITELILLSRIEAGEHTVDDTLTDIDTLLNQICHDARVLSDSKQHEITLTITDPRLLRGDDSQLRSAFSNLIFNAEQSTPAEGRIDGHSHVERDGAHIPERYTRVRNDPLHIPPQTERYNRSEITPPSGWRGSGLGLCIVKHALIKQDVSLDIRMSPAE